MGQNWVLNVDVKDFFPSITSGRIKAIMQIEPIGAQESVAGILASLCSYNGLLPQGSPASPAITNLVCQRLDRRLETFALSKGCRYSRYADDITFSNSEHVFKGDFFRRMEQITRDEGFVFNIKKTRLLGKSMRQEVTGVTVNEKLNVSRKYIHEVRAMVHNFKTKGIEHCQSQMDALRGNQTNNFVSVLHGKLLFLSMVRGDTDPLVNRMMDDFKNSLNG